MESFKQRDAKKWTKMFMSRVEHIEKNQPNYDHLLQDRAPTKLELTTTQLLMARKAGAKMKKKLLEKIGSCKKSLLTLKPPATVEKWETHWEPQLICIFCEQPAVHDAICCQYCDVVVHQNCLLEMQDIDAQEYGVGEPFCCTYCQESIATEEGRYEAVRQSLERDQEQVATATVIKNAAASYVARKAFIRRKEAMIVFQTAVRKKLARDTFLRWRRGQARIMIVQLAGLLPPLPDTAKVSSVSSPGKQQQNRRFGRVNPAMLASTTTALHFSKEDLHLARLLRNKAVLILSVVDPIKQIQLLRCDVLLDDALERRGTCNPLLPPSSSWSVA